MTCPRLLPKLLSNQTNKRRWENRKEKDRRMRQLSGYNFLEALEHLTDSDAFRRVEDKIRLALFRVNSSARTQELAELTAPLQGILFDRLRQRDVLAAARSFTTNFGEPFILLPPATFSLPGLAYDWSLGNLTAPDYLFWCVEFFLPNDPPYKFKNLVERHVTLVAPASAASLPKVTSPHAPAPFWHDEDYVHVRLHGREFTLSKLQAKIVGALHDAARSDHPWVHLEVLRERVGFETAKLQGLFRRQKAWKQLIQSDGRGGYRLAL